MQTEASADITIDDMRQQEKRLGLKCSHCHRFRYMSDARFDPDVHVSKIAENLKCARCGSTEVKTFPVSRDPASGYWPAEGS
ncbi:hypothetical protein [Roseibium algae]|uniref:Uncharacterized protein n=1 Tax=Roseibium algae TaxID=3123038 RepID=A0ABU8TRA3_9HYPH